MKQAEQEKAAAAEQARIAAEKAAEEKKQQLAAVAPTDKPEQPAVDLPRALQAELRRVGCSTGTVDGNWNAASQKALDLFNKHTGMKLEVKIASTDALDAVKGKTGRICPLICDTGFRADGDRCMKITCRAGYRVNDDNECEKVQDKKPVAKREEPTRKRSAQNEQRRGRTAKPASVRAECVCRAAMQSTPRGVPRAICSTQPGGPAAHSVNSATIADPGLHPMPDCSVTSVTFAPALDCPFRVIEYRSLVLDYPDRCQARRYRTPRGLGYASREVGESDRGNVIRRRDRRIQKTPRHLWAG